MLAVALFTAINVIVGCYVAIRLGYGPPSWQVALNLVVRVTTLQDWLNAGRDFLGKKARWADMLLVRLRVPKPIIIADTPEETTDTTNETNEANGTDIADATDENSETNDHVSEPPSGVQSGSFADVAADALQGKLEPHDTGTEQVPPNENADAAKNR